MGVDGAQRRIAGAEAAGAHQRHHSGQPGRAGAGRGGPVAGGLSGGRRPAAGRRLPVLRPQPGYGVNSLYQLVRADLLERSRRYSFLVTLGLVLYLGYAANTGQILLRREHYRGILNSAWVGIVMALVVNFFLCW